MTGVDTRFPWVRSGIPFGENKRGRAFFAERLSGFEETPV